MAIWVQILGKDNCISHHANMLDKVMYLTILLSATGLGEGKLWILTC